MAYSHAASTYAPTRLRGPRAVFVKGQIIKKNYLSEILYLFWIIWGEVPPLPPLQELLRKKTLHNCQDLALLTFMSWTGHFMITVPIKISLLLGHHGVLVVGPGI